VKIQKEDSWKTNFRTCYGHYQFLMMPFGMNNTPLEEMYLLILFR